MAKLKTFKRTTNIFKKDTISAHDVFEVDVTAMATYFDLQRGHAYRELKIVFQALMDKKLKIAFGDTKIISPWLSAIRYNDVLGLLQIQLSPIVCDHVSIKLLSTEYFTQYHLKEISVLKYKFSIPLFTYLNSCTFKEGETLVFEESNIRAIVVTLNIDSFNISSNYTFSTGQEGTFYDFGTINRKSDSDEPTKKLKIYFQNGYYQSSDDGDITTVNSYNTFDYTKEIQNINGISNSYFVGFDEPCPNKISLSSKRFSPWSDAYKRVDNACCSSSERIN